MDRRTRWAFFALGVLCIAMGGNFFVGVLLMFPEQLCRAVAAVTRLVQRELH